MKKLKINDHGVAFFNKWENDSKQGMFIYGPLGVLIFTVLFSMIVGFSLKLIGILIFPFLLVFIAFFKAPLLSRKKYFNNTIKTLNIDDKGISFETFKWFYFDAKSMYVSKEDLTIAKLISDDFFKNENVLVLKIKNRQEIFYFVTGFFDDDNIISDLEIQYNQ